MPGSEYLGGNYLGEYAIELSSTHLVERGGVNVLARASGQVRLLPADGGIRCPGTP